MRSSYAGFSLSDNVNIDTELVSNVILDLKLGEAADFTGLKASTHYPYVRACVPAFTVEHLHYSHPIISVLLSYLFQLMFSFHYIPAGCKYSYIVPLYQNPKTCVPGL